MDPEFYRELFGELILGVGAIVVIVSFFMSVFRFIFEYLNIKSCNKRREEYRASFNLIVSNLSSQLRATQLSSAILLRRFLDKKVKRIDPDLTKETITVISSLVRTLPTNVFQKTLVDGLSYAVDLSLCDLQKTNLQDALLYNKNHQILMNKTDLFLADLSYANLKNIVGHNIIFYRSILFCTSIKNCDFTNGDFRGADLSGVNFKECILKGADFTNAVNVPQAIVNRLVDGIFSVDGPVNASHEMKNKTIFFSMPGMMSKSDEYLTKEYKRILEGRGYYVTYYTRDKYPQFGQFNKVRTDILHSSGMIAFGLKQVNIQKGFYRPNTEEENLWENKWLSTPWNEIEVGMGLMKGMPILLVCDPNINEGIFDSNLSECFVARISTAEDCRLLEQNMAFEEWISRV